MVGQLPLEQHIGVRILAVSVKRRGRTTSRSQLGSVASDLHYFAPTGPPMSTAGWCWHRIYDSKSLIEGCALFI